MQYATKAMSVGAFANIASHVLFDGTVNRTATNNYPIQNHTRISNTGHTTNTTTNTTLFPHGSSDHMTTTKHSRYDTPTIASNNMSHLDPPIHHTSSIQVNPKLSHEQKDKQNWEPPSRIRINIHLPNFQLRGIRESVYWWNCLRHDTNKHDRSEVWDALLSADEKRADQDWRLVPKWAEQNVRQDPSGRNRLVLIEEYMMCSNPIYRREDEGYHQAAIHTEWMQNVIREEFATRGKHPGIHEMPEWLFFADNDPYLPMLTEFVKMVDEMVDPAGWHTNTDRSEMSQRASTCLFRAREKIRQHSSGELKGALLSVSSVDDRKQYRILVDYLLDRMVSNSGKDVSGAWEWHVLNTPFLAELLKTEVRAHSLWLQFAVENHMKFRPHTYDIHNKL